MRKLFSTAGLAVLFYLIQVCIMPHLEVNTIVGNVLLAYIAVVAVAYSPFFAYVAGAIIGVLMEIMLAPFEFINLVIYPVLALLGGYAFADKSERKLEQERSMGKSGTNISPYLRTPLCAGMMALVKEVVNRTYIYLTGVELTWLHISRGLTAILYTMVLSLIIMFPIRRLLGLHIRKQS